jgi:glutamine amidotransferase
MCRLLAYTGEPVFLEELICKPQHSLVRQSMQAEEAKLTTHGDGFGIGWYTGIAGRLEPGLYREVTPAWSDENLLALCAAVQSPLFFAHVRATTGTAVARQNCHPFRYHNHLFIHNGQIGGYPRIRRRIEAQLSDELYAARKGATDSELMFLLAVAGMQDGLSPCAAIKAMLDKVRSAMAAERIGEPLRFTAVHADGERVHAFRYSSDDRPPTLYLNRGQSGTIMASEPLQDRAAPCCQAWETVPPNTMIRVSAGGRAVTMSPI